MSIPVIEAVGLRCSYGAFEAVRGVDFHVDKGELVALLGTNGAGKTTTVETLEGLRRPSSGTVRVLGLDPFHDRAEVRRRTGAMLQDSGFAGELTVLETAKLWRDLSSRPGDVDASLDMLNLADRAAVRVKQLSGGERRRLDLLLATLGQPEVVFLDEPTTGLDPTARRGAWEIIRGLVEHGASVLLTTHYLEEAEQLADRLVLMNEGRVAVSGTLSDVLASEPASISFDLPAGIGLEQLPVADSAFDPDRSADGRVHLRTSSLQRDLTTLLSWAAAQGLYLGRLRAQHASLEEVFHAVDRGLTRLTPSSNADQEVDAR
jgi:ABC-2 type transport system ATP-binding protein